MHLMRKVLLSAVATTILLAGGARAQQTTFTYSGRPIGPHVGYNGAIPGWSGVSLGGMVVNSRGQTFGTMPGCFSYPINAGSGSYISAPDARTWYQTTGKVTPPPVFGTVVADILPLGAFNNTGDMALIQATPFFLSPVDWGLGSEPSMYIRNSYIGEHIFKDGSSGYTDGVVLALGLKLFSYMSIGARAPKAIYNLCDLRPGGSYLFAYYGLVASTVPVLATDLGAWEQSLDSGTCHHAENSVFARNIATVVNGHTVVVTLGAPLANEFPYWGVHVYGGNACGSGQLIDPVVGQLAIDHSMDNVVQTDAIHSPGIADWQPSATESPQFLNAQSNFRKTHPMPATKRLSATQEAEYNRAADVINDHAYDAMFERWAGQDNIPIQTESPDIENGKVYIVLGLLTTPEKAKQFESIIWHDLGPEHTLGGFPVRIFGVGSSN